jgi:hypothetical protein
MKMKENENESENENMRERERERVNVCVCVSLNETGEHTCEVTLVEMNQSIFVFIRFLKLTLIETKQ